MEALSNELRQSANFNVQQWRKGAEAPGARPARVLREAAAALPQLRRAFLPDAPSLHAQAEYLASFISVQPSSDVLRPQELDLSGYDSPVQSLVAVLTQRNHVRSVVLADLNLGDADAVVIAGVLSASPHARGVSHLNLNSNQLTLCGLERLLAAASMRGGGSLELLLHDNDLDPAAPEVAAALSKGLGSVNVRL